MADADLTQELGFDASSAISTLENLDGLMAKFEQRWNSAASSLKSFNDAGKQTSNQLSAIARQANAAAAALGKLNTSGPSVGSGGGNAANQLLQGQAAANAMNALLGKTSSQANAAATAVGQVGSAANKSMGAAAVATGKFTVSFETLVRVISTQLIVRALSALRNEIEQSFTANLAFVKSLSEIQTIDAGHTIEQLSTEVRGISDAFNIPLLDTAKAKYEILSNGFTTAADQANLFSASAKFSKTAIAEMSTSIDLLSGTLNAYGLSSEQAETVAAKFFKTVDLGKVVGSELATSFGRVAPVAAELGVSISELDASFSTITIAGVKASEAATQIRASLTALLKPSDAAKSAIHELGFENGQQLLAAKGLQGAFEALISTTNGQSDSIAKLFPNVRALNAVLRLTGTGVDTFKDHLQQISTISNDTFNKTYQLRISTNAEQVSSDLNKLSNFFTAELGASLVGATRSAFGFVGGVEAITDGLKAMAPVAVLAGGALLSYGTYAAYASLQSRLAAADATKLGLAMSTLFAAAAAFAAGSFIGERLVDSLEGAQKQFEKTMDDWINTRRAAGEQEVQIEQQKDSKIVQAFNDFIGKQRKAYFESVDVARESNENILSDTKSTLDKIIQARQEHAKDLARLVGQGQSNITESQQRQHSASNEAADSAFNFRNGQFGSRAQIFQLQRRAQDIAAAAANQLSQAKTPDQLQGALGQFNRASGFAQQAQSIAQSNGSLSQQAQVQRTILGILDQKVRAERQFQQLQEKQVKQAQAASAEEEKRVTTLKSLAKEILKGGDLFDKKGNPLSDKERQSNLANAKKALTQFESLAFSRNKFDMADLFKFDDLKRRLESSVTGAEIHDLHVLPDSLSKLNQQISKGVGTVEVAVRLAEKAGLDVSKLKGKNALETFQGLGDLAGDKAKQIQEQGNLGVLRQFHLDKAKEFAGEVQSIFAAQNQPILNNNREGAQRAARGLPLPGLDNSKEVAASITVYENLKQRVIDYANGVSLSDKEVQQLVKDTDFFLQNAPKWAKVSADVFALASALGKAGDAATFRKLVDANPLSKPSGQGALQSDRNTLSELGESLGIVDKTVQSLSENAGATTQAFQAQVDLATELAAQMERQAVASERIKAAQAISGAGGSVAEESFGGMPNAQHYARGGMVKYFDQGGWAPRGTDTVPAMLSPGEFVVNAASSRKFYSQLSAMNAGAAPSFSPTSHVDNSIHVGDVVIQGGTASKVGPREVARAIQRELRKGTIPNKF